MGLLLHIPLVAQHSGFGLKAGPLLSNQRSGAMSSRLIPNGSIGGYFALRAGTRFELQPEVLITSLGAGFTLPDGGRASVRTVYAQVPLSAKLYLGNVFNLQAGLQMGRLLMAQQSGPEGTANVTDSYVRWDYGITLGLGADLVTGTDIGFRYYNGLSPVLAEDETYFPRNQAYMISMGRRLSRLKSPKFTRRRG